MGRMWRTCSDRSMSVRCRRVNRGKFKVEWAMIIIKRRRITPIITTVIIHNRIIILSSKLIIPIHPIITPSPTTTTIPTLNIPILTIPIQCITTPAPLNFITISNKTSNLSSNSKSNKPRDRCNSCINNKKSDCNFWKNRLKNSLIKKS